MEEVRAVRDEIRDRVDELATELDASPVRS
jgi:predicted transcriptional regulator